MSSSTPYRDSAGRALADYPRPSVAVDTAVLTVLDGRLAVLLVRGGDGQGRLPGTFLHEGETLAGAVARSVREKAGISNVVPRQLHVFDAPGRDDRGWVLSVAHMAALVATAIPLSDRTVLVPVDELGPLGFDHAEIVEHAVARLREDYRRLPDPWRLLDRGDVGVTMRHLRLLHESVLGERLVADTFRRTMLPGLEPTGEMARGGRGKPAELFRIRRNSTL